MCGIAILISPDSGLARSVMPRMLAAMPHRGPDDVGEAYLPMGNDLTVALGHRRLSIIDLSACGHQPMAHPETGDQLIFNGEIYNFAVLRSELESLGHRFVGHSDSEVLLHALSRWGPDVLPRLQGMFAFGFYCARDRSILLARDSIGIKPLYAAAIPAASGGGWMFASEVRALLATGLAPRDLDRAGIAGLLAYGAVQHPRTIFTAIRSLPPGHYQLIAPSNASAPPPPVPFWRYPAPRNAPISEEVTVQEVRDTITSSVRDHLVADVPVGVFLSSGIDSTIVAGVARRHAQNIRCFTVGFADNPDMSELELARETARLLQLDHVACPITSQDAEEATRAWLGSSDLPSVDGFNVYVISRAVRAQGITVALSGQGGDELFGGYPSFRDLPKLRRWMSRTAWVPARLRRSLAGVVAAKKPASVRAKLRDIAAGSGSLLSLYAQRRRLMSDDQLTGLGFDAATLGLNPDYLDPVESDALALRDEDAVWSVSLMETRLYLGNMLLRDSDVNGMAFSLEIRVPLLDQRLLDLACALPGRTRLPDGAPPKHLLRQAFPELLRPALTQQGKKGFTLPIKRWMLGPLREMSEDGIEYLKSTHVVRPEGADEIWGTFRRESESPIWTRAFMLAVLGLYLRDKVERSW